MFWTLLGVAFGVAFGPRVKRWMRGHHRPRAVLLLPMRARSDDEVLSEAREQLEYKREWQHHEREWRRYVLEWQRRMQSELTDDSKPR